MSVRAREFDMIRYTFCRTIRPVRFYLGGELLVTFAFFVLRHFPSERAKMSTPKIGRITFSNSGM